MTKAFCKDPLGKKVCIKCNTDDAKWYTILNHHVSLGNNEIHSGMNLELYYQ
ncbi:hypothetical protein FD754_009057 [Muntiacus muntjak]|uniref:Ubiquitin-like protein 5 n=1 Tax=Muntiacus muntjak TaxID=9888 RepID=A0A5N3WTC2_MUNMU|nr:hypothetical protein FD754_009057 [Muntiacus muntjak]